jgi:uncharacterized protein (TIGR02145 family)
MLMSSCNKEVVVQVPILSTSEIVEITPTSAICGGNITNDGGAAITSRGVCWSTEQIPTLDDNFTRDGKGIGNFTSNLTGLKPNTTYYVRAYAVNSKGTGYGVLINMFKTQPPMTLLPELITAIVTEIKLNSARCAGYVSSDGGSSVTDRGICWGKSATPTLSDSVFKCGQGTGDFSCYLNNLDPDARYYIRAYATNGNGTNYGEIKSFTTLPLSGQTITDIDGNVYHTLTVNTQVWMAENLKVSHYRDGTLIPADTDNENWRTLTTDACCDYDNNPENNKTYGKIYNWYATDSYHLLCPSGWHMPSEGDWKTLINYLGGDSVAGGKLKEMGIAHWKNPNMHATDEIGFKALPAGTRNSNGFLFLGYMAEWWTSTSYNYSGYVYYSEIEYISGSIKINIQGQGSGLSVRCIRDN